MEETQRQNIVMAFNNVLRTSTLLTHIDLQRRPVAGIHRRAPDHLHPTTGRTMCDG